MPLTVLLPAPNRNVICSSCKMVYDTPVSTLDGQLHPILTMTDDIQRFITRWQASGAAERANYQLFLSELCDVLDAPRPDPTTPDEAGNAYVFEKNVRRGPRRAGRAGPAGDAGRGRGCI